MLHCRIKKGGRALVALLYPINFLAFWQDSGVHKACCSIYEQIFILLKYSKQLGPVKRIPPPVPQRISPQAPSDRIRGSSDGDEDTVLVTGSSGLANTASADRKRHDRALPRQSIVDGCPSRKTHSGQSRSTVAVMQGAACGRRFHPGKRLQNQSPAHDTNCTSALACSALVRFALASPSIWARKYSSDNSRPVRRSIAGFHPSSVAALEMSGRRREGSSWGSASYRILLRAPGYGKHLPGAFQYRHLSWVADIDRQMLL